MANWNHLSPELRHMVWQLLAADSRRSKNLGQRPCTAYAAVCREWQGFFEQVNFRQLILSPARVSALNRTVRPHRRGLVQHIWLRIELPEFPCGDCQLPDSEEEIHRNNRTFSTTFQSLFKALSRWDESRKGVTLEFSIHSPSDSKHHFKDRAFHAFEWTGEECLHNIGEAQMFLARTSTTSLDRFHSGEDLRLSVSPKLKLAGDGLCLRRKLCTVRVITGFLIRRQYYRYINPQSVSQILQSLPALQHMNYEMWRVFDREIEADHDSDLQSLFASPLPTTLRRLAVFEDSDSVLHEHLGHPRYTNTSLALALVKASRSLEELSLAFLVDAKQFFLAFHLESLTLSDPQREWENLTTVALTSKILNPTSERNDIDDLLQAAGYAAIKMPNLGTLELWNGRKGEGAIFRYERATEMAGPDGEAQCQRTIIEYSTAIAWYSTWDSCLGSCVIEAWRSVALKYPRRELTVHTGRIPEPQSSYGSILALLKLRRRILHPVSLHQVLWEAENPESF